MESKCLISANYSFNVIHIAAVRPVCVCVCVCVFMCVSIYWPLSVLCLYFCVSDVKLETSKKPNYVSDLSKGPSGTKIPGLDMCRSMDP